MKVLADKNWEYKYVSDLAITTRKFETQWKHEFELAIIHTEFATPFKGNETYINMLIARRRKNYDL